MDNKQEIFTKFIDEFVKLDINQKNHEIIEKQKTILAYLFKYAVEHNIKYDFLRSKEIKDIEHFEATNEDYLEAMMVYSENIEELIGSILKG